MAIQAERHLANFGVAAATGTSFVIGYLSAANTVARADGSGRAYIGIIENDPALADESASVCIGGLSKVHAGTGAISRGDSLTADARGYAVATTNDLDQIVGRAVDASTADGQLIAVVVSPKRLSI